MATVKIGGRELAVWSKKDDGSLGRFKLVLQAERALQDAAADQVPDLLAALVHCYVGHNEGATVEWLLGVLPADARDVLGACVAATGSAKAEASQGEAKSP